MISFFVLFSTRPRFYGYQQLNRIKHFRHSPMPGSSVADKIVVLAHPTGQTLHQYKFRRTRVQRYIIALYVDAIVHCIRV